MNVLSCEMCTSTPKQKQKTLWGCCLKLGKEGHYWLCNKSCANQWGRSYYFKRNIKSLLTFCNCTQDKVKTSFFRIPKTFDPNHTVQRQLTIQITEYKVIKNSLSLTLFWNLAKRNNSDNPHWPKTEKFSLIYCQTVRKERLSLSVSYTVCVNFWFVHRQWKDSISENNSKIVH